MSGEPTTIDEVLRKGNDLNGYKFPTTQDELSRLLSGTERERVYNQLNMRQRIYLLDKLEQKEKRQNIGYTFLENAFVQPFMG